MKKGHKKLVLLGAAILMLLLAGQALASGLDGGAEADTTVSSCRYYYWLEPKASDEGAGTAAAGTDWQFDLYVKRTDPERALLLTGYISLAADGTLNFDPAEGWVTFAVPYPNDDGSVSDSRPVEIGTVDNRGYISFGWHWDQGGKPLEDSKLPGDESLQLLGTLTISGDKQPELDDIELLPWPETQTGSAQIQAWRDQQTLADAGDPEADPEGYLSVIVHTWRFPALPSLDGFYQGYCVPEDTGGSGADSSTDSGFAGAGSTGGLVGEEGNPPNVDLTAGWYGFRIGAYAPERPVELTFYEAGTAGTEQPVVIAKSTYAFAELGSGTYGHFRKKIDFGTLAYTSDTAVPLSEEETEKLLNGRCDLTVSKPSHASCTFENLQFTGGVCDLLLGVYVELPCGNVNGDKDGKIRQDDRADLTAPDRYGTKYPDEAQTDPNKEPCDLDGDHRVDQTDLSILIAPANYGKENFTYNFEG